MAIWINDEGEYTLEATYFSMPIETGEPMKKLLVKDLMTDLEKGNRVDEHLSKPIQPETTTFPQLSTLSQPIFFTSPTTSTFTLTAAQRQVEQVAADAFVSTSAMGSANFSSLLSTTVNSQWGA